jgi:hypothetical protein
MKKLYLIFLMTILAVALSNAQIIDVNFGTGGTNRSSGWVGVNNQNYTGYGSFPGSAPWPSPIRANQGITNPTLNRTAGSPSGGGPFLATDSIYFGSFSQVPNALGGTLRLSDTNPLSNLRTVVFQIQIGEALGFDFFSPSGFPKLSLNGGTSTFASFTNLVNRYQNGVFPSPETGQDEPVYVNTWAYQWNLGSTPATSYNIDFSGVTHSQVYALRLDTTSLVYNTPVIPEPSVLGYIFFALVAFLVWRLWR